MQGSSDMHDALAAHRLLDRYQRLIHEASAGVPALDVASPDARAHISHRLREHLGVREEWVPTPRIEVLRESRSEGFTIRWLAGSTWPGVTATALLYVPDDPAGDGSGPPLVLLGCGHGRGGKLNPGYQQMARALARRGAAVLCPDNLGQGERAPMGHGDAVAPFACGLSVQGLIVMETLGWLRWARENLPIDRERVAAIGNSGGGTLVQMLMALDDGLAAAASTGYPSTYGFIAAKEKKHCHCNILPGIVGSLEMHQVYGAFAPKPLLLMQGEADPLFPPDLFHLTARRVRATYEQLGAADKLTTLVTPGGHSWDSHRIEIMATFLGEHLGLRTGIEPAPQTDALLADTDSCLPRWPDDAHTVDELASELTGVRPPAGLRLWDVFPHGDEGGKPFPSALSRGDVRQVLAQMQAFLGRP